jgi:hypothetical protein
MRILFISIFSFVSVFAVAQFKALVGGTLIDGFGSHPIQNSVIIIEGEKILKVGTIDNTPIPEETEISGKKFSIKRIPC